MTALVPFFRFIRLIFAESTPAYVAGGLSLALWIAFSPLVSIQMIILLLALFLIRVNLVAVAAGLILFTPLSQLCVYPSRELGSILLLKSPALTPLWAWMAHAPILPFTQFNDTYVLGQATIALLLTPLLFFLSRKYWKKYRPYFSYRLKESRLYRRINQSYLYDAYKRTAPRE